MSFNDAFNRQLREDAINELLAEIKRQHSEADSFEEIEALESAYDVNVDIARNVLNVEVRVKLDCRYFEEA